MNISNEILGALSTFIRESDRFTSTNRYPSLYRGVVENVADPLLSGRVQVRVPAAHGLNMGKSGDVSESNRFIPTKNLPWASVVSAGGGSFDRGSSLPLSSGALVLVAFEAGDVYSPVVVGQLNCFPNLKTPINTDPWEELPTYPVPLGIGAKNQPQPTFPNEAGLGFRQSATRFVIHKSLKGHTVWGEDRDDAECFEMVDRNGQGIRMEGFVSVDDNKGNEARRKTGTVFSRSAVTKSNISRVLVKEVGNNSITMESYEKEKRLRIGSGKSRLELDGIRNRATLGNVTDGQRIEIDGDTQTIRIKSPQLIIDAEEIIFKGHTRFYNSVEVLGNLYSYRRFVVNELNDSLPRAVTTRKKEEAAADDSSNPESYPPGPPGGVPVIVTGPTAVA